MGDFKWTTPSRRRGSRILSLLPTEVYLEIFAYLEPSEKDNVVDCKHIFSNLALVCRFFCAHAISRVYRSIEFSGRDASSGAPGFCRLLLQGTNSTVQNHAFDARFALHVAQSVRECTFRDWIGIPSAAAFLKSYCKAVGQMPNIECFRFESTPITLPLIQAITRFKATSTTSCIRTNLAKLSIRSCTLDEEIPEKDLTDVSALTLRDVEYWTIPSMLLPPSRLRVRQLEIFRTDSWTFTHYFIKRKHPDLQVLELHLGEDLPALFAFLAKCPSITELIINSIFPKSDHPVPSLTAPPLPNIHTITILPSLLRYFSKRPLRKVSLNGIEIRPGERSICSFPTLPLLSIPDTLPLLQSTAVITELRVHKHIYFLLPFHKHFKDLEVLALSYSHANFTTAPAIFSAGLFHNAVRDVCARWSGAPTLREFHMEFGESDAADSRHFMWDL
ncbi:hypothetical protein B0H17DRAFT_3113 [Mycena rosella]|uniref:F-box domain-containing protein n=1 Tax=Mycena rosella TaxID=1033263 RepID=A0AAD7H2R8_MYCRO|nr:hypothetical protein B0H17DRAFT_3113 [Mycena rosella]